MRKRRKDIAENYSLLAYKATNRYSLISSHGSHRHCHVLHNLF